jgi:hypothetical protein
MRRRAVNCVRLRRQVSTDPTVARTVPRPSSSGARLGIAGAVGLMLLAALETAQALVAPWRAPGRSDWVAAAAAVRGGFRAGDLIVAAPAWADPVLRMHLGDLLTIPAAARMDAARFGRVWEVSQRGARAEDADGQVVREERFGALTLRLVERPAPQVTYDFLERWTEARVSRWDPRARVLAPCPWSGDRFACAAPANTVHRQLVEVDTRIRRAILAPPVAGAILSVEFPAATLGRELVVAAGLHDVWARKYATGTVYVQIWIAGQPAGEMTIGNRSGWRLLHLDTAARDGEVAPVRIQISSARPELRHLAFAAEARR